MIESDVESRAEVGADIMHTFSTKGWQHILGRINHNLQNLVPKAMDEGDEAKQARTEVKSIQKFLNFIVGIEKEAQANMSERAQAELDEKAEEAASPSSKLPSKTRAEV